MHEESSRSSIRGDNFLTDTPRNEDAPLLSDSRKDLDDTWTKPFKFQPLWKIRNYFGERIAFYFAWSGMLCSTLWIPTLFGMCVFFYGMYKSATVREGTSTNGTSIVDSFKDLFGDFKQSFDNDITPYFGLVICVWGTVFLEIWKRKKAELAYEWDVEQFEANEPDRPSFTGTRSKKDPVTEEYVWYYPFKRQFIKFCFSFSVLIMMIAMVLISVVAIITYRVIMDIDYCPNIPAAECLMLTTVLSSVLNAVSILLLSRFYNVLARWLTEWENHRTQTRYDDALIFKLFAFQFVNSYASCFYIAFFRGRFDNVGFVNKAKYTDSCEGSCMTQLSFQVLILMLIKPFPKFFKDIILVWIKKMWRKYPNVCQCLRKLQCCSTTNQVGDGDIEAAVANGKNRARHTQHLQFLKHEHLKPELGDFTLDEYTEKIIQYGFLMLFATSFPLAPLLALLTNMFDLRVDAKRLLWWYRRPIAHVAQDIGMWYQILLFVNFAGVVSNAFLLAFTSTWGASYSTTGKLIIVIAFEHIVFALKYIVSYMIPDTPAHVQLSIRREQYQIQKKMEEPTKDMDYAHLFPVDLIAENGTEHDGGDLSRSRTPSARHPTSPSKKDLTKEAQKKYGLKNTSKQREGSTKTDMRSDDLDASYGGYVDLSEDERRKRLTPTSELWYCGHKSDSDSSNTQLLGQSRTAVAKQPSNTNLSSSRVSRVSASDVKPQGNKLWDSVDEVETQQSAGMRLHSPTYPSANEGTCNLFPNPRNQHQSGNSTTEC
ncbi:hypothetical protein V1264_004595 [Littorina saxatilis]|uniref:Anoctamin n=1 Tax=Littorina saxatilis TaxID=31220 RepID=A0AAN9B2E5_9CAEN